MSKYNTYFYTNIMQWGTWGTIRKYIHPTKSIILEVVDIGWWWKFFMHTCVPHPLLEQLCMYMYVHVGAAYCKCDISFSLVDWKTSDVANY